MAHLHKGIHLVEEGTTAIEDTADSGTGEGVFCSGAGDSECPLFYMTAVNGIHPLIKVALLA